MRYYNYQPMREPHMTTANALTICNACEADDMHAGCHMGYCTGCCPAGGTH